ncbi:hypothetical protein ElyMa_006980500 [Elysia marginata]|uniref:Uncharacterized protein n=1 Tax=Elysia marginata TaxID=1093978 RepID=A0AAV4JMQ4_9GAST|nr:hypothetical protein ElyMa_006980500 [Elysia marginata]
MADSGQASEENFATAATAPVDGTTNWLSQISKSTTTTTHALCPVREARPPSICRFALRGAANSTLKLCRLKYLANIFIEDIANSDKITNSAM